MVFSPDLVKNSLDEQDNKLQEKVNPDIIQSIKEEISSDLENLGKDPISFSNEQIVKSIREELPDNIDDIGAKPLDIKELGVAKEQIVEKNIQDLSNLSFAKQEAISRKERSEVDDVLSEGDMLYDKATKQMTDEIAFAQQEKLNKLDRDKELGKKKKSFAKQEVINRKERLEVDDVLSEGDIIYDDETQRLDRKRAFAKQEKINKLAREKQLGQKKKSFAEQEAINSKERTGYKVLGTEDIIYDKETAELDKMNVFKAKELKRMLESGNSKLINAAMQEFLQPNDIEKAA